MKFLNGYSVQVGLNLQNLPQIALSDPNFSDSMLMDFIRRCYIDVCPVSAEYCPIVDQAYYSDATTQTWVSGYTERQAYDPRIDVQKFSHPIAAAISYLGDGYPSTHQGDNGFLHIASDATVRRRVDKLHVRNEGMWYDLPYKGLNNGPNYYVPVYAVVSQGGSVLSTPAYVYNCYGGGGSISENVRRWVPDVVEKFTLPFTVDGPRVCTIGYWGSFYFHGLETIKITSGDSFVLLEWTEWFSNYLSQRYRKLVCRVKISYGMTKSSFISEYGVWKPYTVSVEAKSSSQWYVWGGPGSGSIYSTLTPSVSYESSSYIGDFDTIPFPLTSVGGKGPIVDLSAVFSDAQIALERCRDGVATSTAALMSTIRQESANWIEFAGEFDELFALLPLEFREEFSGYFANNGKLNFIAGLRNVVKGIAALYIAGRFSISPAVQSGRDIVSLCNDLVSRLDSFGEKHVRSGRKLLVPSPRLFETILVRPDKVHVVSACTVGVPYSGDVPGILAADTYGALPLPSRFWDLAPWSWAVDYFTRYQDKIEAVEAIVMLSIWRARGFTHSVSFDLPQDRFSSILDLYQLEIVDSTDPSLRCYMREISALIPFTALRENYSLVDTETRPDWTILVAIALCFAL